MGCASSKAASSSVPRHQDPARDELTASGHRRIMGLTKSELQQRIDCPEEAKTLLHEGISLKYAWMSQRGYYPDSPDKENQDAYTCQAEFGRSASGGQRSFFAVFDGHGKDGHFCARFARDVLPAEIAKKLEKLELLPSNTNETKYFQEVRHCLELAHLSTNHQMKNDKRFDSEFSGTTAISVLISERRLFVSNVGDSRAILVSENTEGHLVAKALSSDQTPYRADERARVKKFGARVLSMDQIEGLEPVHENWGDLTLGEDIDEGGDPPRIWHPRDNYPGTAFTRSLGDAIAETLGVVAEPEILDRELFESDRYIIIASDGVFEFLTNQMVADLAAMHKEPLAACKAIVDSAYNLWLQYEVRTDDISVIILSLDDFAAQGRMSRASSVSKDEAAPVMDSRPVRRAVSKEKKKNMIQTRSDDGDEGIEESDMAALLVPKTPDEEEAIAGAIKSNFLFQHLNIVQRQAVIGVMQPVMVQKGDWVITQDDHGDKFYVVESGRYEVRVRPPGKVDPTGGFVVHVYESGNGQHPGFGELSLMYGKPRAASVIALEDGKLWALDRRVFKGVVMRSMDVRKDTIRKLRLVPLLKVLNLQQFQRLADMMHDETIPEGKELMLRGQENSTFYLIISGSVTIQGGGEEEGGAWSKTVTADGFLGEECLIAPRPSAVTAVATTSVRARTISFDDFENSVGSMEEIIAADKVRKDTLKQAVVEAPSNFTEVDLLAVVNADNLSSLLLGSFNNVGKPNVAVRSFILSDVDKTGLFASVSTTIETGRVISSSSVTSVFVPRLLRVYRDPNALHLLFNASPVMDLYSLVHPPLAAEEPGGPPRPPPPPATMVESEVVYVAACLTAALEVLHGTGIVYRGIQPEGILITAEGRIVLMDYRVCKVGGVGARSFTICGAADYLSPEQISQRGHGAPVDLWALGVLLYELTIGTTPFSAASEVATYSKISSFGSTAFPCLLYPEASDDIPAPSSALKSLMNKLLVPAPEARLGAGARGFEDIKAHALFHEINWDNLDKVQSPLFFHLQEETSDVLHDGLRDHSEFLESFSKPFVPAGADWAADIV